MSKRNLGTLPVETIDGRTLVIVDRNNRGVLAAALPADMAGVTQVEAREDSNWEGAGVEIFDGATWRYCRQDIYLVHDRNVRPWEAVEAAGLDEENLLPGA